jgi:hypothetical protein
VPRCRKQQQEAERALLLAGATSISGRSDVDRDAAMLRRVRQGRTGVEEMLEQAGAVLAGMGATRETLKARPVLLMRACTLRCGALHHAAAASGRPPLIASVHLAVPVAQAPITAPELLGVCRGAHRRAENAAQAVGHGQLDGLVGPHSEDGGPAEQGRRAAHLRRHGAR